MFYARDTFSGFAGQPLQAHVAELGGIPTPNPVFAASAMQLLGNNTARQHSTGDTYYFYPNAVPVADMIVQATIQFLTLANLSYAGLCARGSATVNETIVGRFEIGTNTFNWYVVVGGGVSSSGSFPYTVTAGDTIILQIQCIGSVATFIANGSAIGTANVSALNHAGCGGLNILSTNLLSTNAVFSEFSVQTPSSPPTTPATAQLQNGNVTAVYQPIGTGTFSSLTFYSAARNLIVKGPQADAAWDWIIHNTPPDMIFPTT